MALPKPTLQARPSAGLSFLTDEPLFVATGVRLGFSRRQGGVSEPPYDGLNLGDHVEDDPMAVAENRALLLMPRASGVLWLLTLNQVHGDVVLALDDDAAAAWEEVTRAGAAGADGVAVAVPDVTALLCFADCTPVIVVSPSGAYAVAHAGWRGALAGIPAKAVEALAALDARAGRAADPSEYNAYIGPHIGAECYECAPRPRRPLRRALRALVRSRRRSSRFGSRRARQSRRGRCRGGAHRVVGGVHRLPRRPLLLVSQKRRPLRTPQCLRRSKGMSL